MIRTKITSTGQEKMLPREKLMRKMEEDLEHASVLYLWAQAGAGKTGALLEYIKRNHITSYLVWTCDAYDNTQESIEILEDCIKKDDYQLIILQSLENLKDEMVLRRLTYQLEHLPQEIKAMCLSKRRLPDTFQDMFYRGMIAVICADDLMFDYMEVRDFFRSHRIHLTAAETKKLHRMTNGWPGVLALFRLHWSKIFLESPQAEYYIQRFLKEQLIKDLSEKEMHLIQCGKIVPFFDEVFCREVFEIEMSQGELVVMLQSGLLTYDNHHKGYMISSFICQGTPSLKQSQMNLIRMKAANWYERKGDYREMFSVMEDVVLLERKLKQYVKVLIRKLSLVELEEYMSQCENVTINQPWMYLKGWVAARRNQKELLEECLHYLKVSDNMEGTELYLNLAFADGSMGILDWMEEVDLVWDSNEKLQLYTMSGGSPLMSNGLKDFTVLFSGSIKEERTHLKWWSSKVAAQNCLGLQLARYDYFLEILQDDKVEKEIEEIFDPISQTGDGELLLSLIYILRKLQSENEKIHVEEVLDSLLKQLEKCKEVRIEENARTMELLVDKRQDRELGMWMMYEAPRDQVSDIQENNYLLSLKAKGYLKMGQYKKAANLADKLALMFEKNQLAQVEAESLFIESVALYEMGDKKQAIAIAIKAIAVGTKNRYIDIYTAYGETGWKLLEEYHRVIDYHLPEKKQYYYGNVLRADFDGYQSILLRRVKKGRKHKYIAGEHDEKNISNLTMTELTILRLIARGLSNREISEEMNIKVTTVKTHIYTIYRKLGVSTRVQGINIAKEKGIL